MPITTCIFDAYGTLFDVAAAARRAASEPDHACLADSWPALATAWRARQLQYTWLRAITGAHADFGQVTGEALDWALEAQGLAGDAGLRARLMALYRELDAYAEVPAMLEALKRAGKATAILSNGTPDMLADAVEAAGLGALLDDLLSVESVGIYKPHPSVYDLVGQRFGCDRSEVLFVSSNGWDAGAAAGYGFVSAWVNRANEPVDRLPWRPAHVLADLSGIPHLAEAIA
ncbi:haloacid dehalogenase type II [Rhodovulum visakhapatnamense]|uniref:(S)-2-haloacid dehalogenase n=1 Tax=Rhodovulum visakhapatnamense TaxID=364297 RepID=A0A4R8G111_9RHOB|nr:haloacid dehalogenase type II [Rhodovulum visakhapatnamense]TDX29662.1 2-haloacid dehalogenase [Rhodovulum visakhapatnamense]